MTQLVTWNQYRAVRIYLLQALIAAITLIRPSPSSLDVLSLRACWESTTVTLASGICETVPNILGDIDECGERNTPWTSGRALPGYSLLWPLRAVVQVRNLPREKKSCVVRTLEYISDTLGIGQASAIVKVARWMDESHRIKELVPGQS